MLLQLRSLRIQGGPNLGEKPPPKSTSISPKCSGTTQEVRNMTFHPPWVLLVPSARPYNEKPASLSSLTAETKTKNFIYPILLVLIWPFSNEPTSLTTFDTWWVFFSHSGQSRSGAPISNIKNSQMRSAMSPNGYSNSVKTNFSIAITVLHSCIGCISCFSPATLNL